MLFNFRNNGSNGSGADGGKPSSAGNGHAAEPERKRRLEEIFADDPYLSPTMRARRLREYKEEAPPNPFADGIPQVAAVGAAEIHKAPPPPGSISLTEARNKLRALALSAGARNEGAEGQRLQRLRDDALVPWLFDMRKAGWKG